MWPLQQVSRSKGEDLAREYSIPFIETSAKGNVNVEEAFMYVTFPTSLSATSFIHCRLKQIFAKGFLCKASNMHAVEAPTMLCCSLDVLGCKVRGE